MDILVLVFSLVAGIAGTGIGGIIGALLKNKGTSMMGKVLAFAGGVMIGVVAFEMVPDAIDNTQSLTKIGSVALTVGTIAVGMAIIFGINKLLDFIEKQKHQNPHAYHSQALVQSNAVKAYANADFEHELDTELHEAQGEVSNDIEGAVAHPGEGHGALHKNLVKTGVIMLIAIALHNLPEGMAIGASGATEVSTGLLVAIIIAVHNIPEGMAIAGPLVSGGVNAVKAVLLTALAGFATVVGALIGLAVGGIGQVATGVCLGLASGAMLYVTFLEILPEALEMNGGKLPAVSMLCGIVCSIVFVFAF